MKMNPSNKSSKRRFSARTAPLIAAALVMLMLSPLARADDTIEVFDPGLSDFEAFFPREQERELEEEWVLGYGITPRLSALITYNNLHGYGMTVPTYGGGFIYTPVDSVVSWDIIGSAGYEDAPSGEDDARIYVIMSELSGGPGPLVLFGRAGCELVDSGESEWDYLLTGGAAYRPVPEIELIGSYDYYTRGVFAHDQSWSAGINAMLTDDFELLTEYRQSFEIESDKWVEAYTVGFILTMEKLGSMTAVTAGPSR